MKKNYECIWKGAIALPHLKIYQERTNPCEVLCSPAWDKIFRNSNVIREIYPEILMSDITYQQIVQEKNGIRVVLEFPTQSEQTDNLYQEIKSILSSALREQLQKIS